MGRFAVMNTEQLYNVAASCANEPISSRPANLYQWLRWAVGLSYKGTVRPHEENARQAVKLAKRIIKQAEYEIEYNSDK